MIVGLALVLIDMRHDLLEGANRLAQQFMVAMGLGRLFEDIVEQEQSAGQALHRPNQELNERLPATFGSRLSDLEEGVKAWLGAIARNYGLFGLLVEVQEGRVDFEQRLGVVQVDLSNRHRLFVHHHSAGESFETVFDRAVRLVDGRQVAEYLFDLGRVQDRPSGLVRRFDRIFKYLFLEVLWKSEFKENIIYLLS